MHAQGVPGGGGIRFVLLRRQNGLPWRNEDTLFTAADMADTDRFPGKPTPYTSSTKLYFGIKMVTAGDLDGDGVDDLLVRDTNSVFVLFLERSSRFVRDWHRLDFGATSVAGSGGLARFRPSSDFFGDGHPDFVIGASATSSNDGAIVIASLSDSGRAVAHSTLIARGINGGPTLHPVGSALGVGSATVPDEDGDGLDEVLVAASLSSVAYRIRLNADGTAKPNAHYMTTSTPASSGRVIAPVGTIGCGSGVASFRLNAKVQRPQTVISCASPTGELLFYRPQSTTVSVVPGALPFDVEPSSVSGTVSLASNDVSFATYTVVTSYTPDDHGYLGAVAYMGDWDGDGNGDIAVGAVHMNAHVSYAGGAFVALLDDDGSWPQPGQWGLGTRSVLFTNGEGGFAPNAFPAGGHAGIGIAANIDLDGNGVTDFVLSHSHMTSAVRLLHFCAVSRFVSII